MSAGPSSTSSPRDAARPSLTGRRSLLSMRQSFGTSAGHVPTTPRRNGAATPTGAPALPTPTAASRYLKSTSSASTQKSKALEIGDEVIMDGTGLVGVLRHLGPVAFKPGEYAGLELVGDSAGKGKNDGSVQGVQYFACEAGNGLFCPAHKVSPLSNETPTEATARPQSSMSSVSGRSSVAGGDYRPASSNSGLRSRSSTIGTAARPPSTTPGRTPSRNTATRSGSSLANGTNRLMPRKSIADALADEEGRRRAKSSAEAAEKAEGRITAGSRAHKYLHMNAKDLDSNGKRTADPFTSSSNSSTKTPIRRGRPSSPLKDSLLGSSRGTNGVPTSRGRLSVGPSSMSTPRAMKARTSLFGAKGSTNSMLPPSLPPPASSAGGEIGASLGGRSAPPFPSGLPGRTLSRQSQASPTKLETVAPSSYTDRMARNQMLLEELDLTPKRSSAHWTSNDVSLEVSPERQSAPSPMMTEDDLAGFAITTSEGDEEEVPHGYVPITLYEESTLESARLKTKLGEMEKQLKERNAEVERVKVRVLQEAQREHEEEKQIEREDEARRRRDVESRERETQEKTDALLKDLRKANEELKRIGLQKEQQIKDIECQLGESERLIIELKSALHSGGTKSEEAESSVKAKDVELQQLKERLDRMREERDREREEHLREMDDLKAAGEEAFDIFQKEQALSNEIIQEGEERMAMLEAKAQEAIIEVERQRDEALQGMKPDSIADIDHQSVQEQLNQAQNRIMLLEDQLAESNLVMQQERESAIKRKERSSENEVKLKAEIAKIRAEHKKTNIRETEAKARIDELMEALGESKAALENERAELEILRTEALVIGSDEHSQPLSEREKARLESEVERLNGLLEGARSGKREANRQVDELRREYEGLHNLIKEVKLHLKNVEAEKSALELRLGNGKGGDISSIADLKRALREKTIEVEALQRSSLPPSEQVLKLIEDHKREMMERDEEIVSLRQKLDDKSSRYSLSVPSSTTVNSTESSQQSPTRSGFGDLSLRNGSSPQNQHRLSNASNFSRKSRNSLQSPTGAETMVKELTGLKSIVNTLNQELTESKVKSMQRDKELSAEVDKWREEARRWQLTLENLQGGDVAHQQDGSSQKSISDRLQLEKKLQEAQQQSRRYKEKMEAVEAKRREEIGKLNQDISELEALCEATVWRREEQDAKRQELERQVDKLQRKLDQALNGACSEVSRSSSTTVKEVLVCDDCGEEGHVMGDDCPYNKNDMLF